MKNILDAGTILANVMELKGYTTRRQLAGFFGVGPSAVSDWVNRKGNRIPERRLARACADHGLSWAWLALGEGSPHEERCVDRISGIELDPAEVELMNRIKSSPRFRRAVHQLLDLDEERLLLLSKVAESMSGGVSSRRAPPSDPPFRKWISRYPLTITP